MMRYALRRILWMIPTLVGITLLAFAVLSFVGLPPVTPALASSVGARAPSGSLPTFFNTHPPDVRSLANEAVDQLAHETQVLRAQTTLVRLGGAALPFVLPRLDALEVDARWRVALAIEPVAHRMELAPPDGFTDGPGAVLFWTRFWEERATDFKASVARRAVRRLATHDSGARHTEITELDTFALDEIMQALAAPVSSAHDVETATRLIDVASHVTDRPDRLAPNATLEEARACLARWHDWWLVAGSDYTVLSAPARLAATVLQTRYAHWVQSVAALRLSSPSDGSSTFEALVHRSLLTLALTVSAMLLAYGAAIAIGLVSALRADQVVDRALSFGVLAAHGLPAVLVITLLATALGPRWTFASATLALVFGLVASPSRQQRTAALDALASDYVRAARGKGVSLARLLVVHVWRPSAISVLTVAGTDFPIAFTGACVAERAFRLPGVSADVVAAVAARDVYFLMSFAVFSATATAVLMLLTDVAYAWIDPRIRALMLREVR